MFNPEKGDRTIKDLVVKNCWQYLFDNFHKFTDTNRIKIALELCKKDMPSSPLVEIDQATHQHFVKVYLPEQDKNGLETTTEARDIFKTPLV